MKSRIPVALFGFGSQGRRIAQAIAMQRDIEVVGVALNRPDPSAHLAYMTKHKIYCTEPRKIRAFEKVDLPVEGSVDSLLSEVKLVVDCAPSGVGKQNKEGYYEKSKVKVIFQAGEDPAIADIPAFFSDLDFEKARKARSVRIASPLAVSVARILLPLARRFGAEDASCVMVRAGSETMRAQLGPVDTIVPERFSSLDRARWELTQLLSGLSLALSSVRVPSILYDVQLVFAKLTVSATVVDVLEILAKTSGIWVALGESGLSSTDSIFEFVRRVRPSSADMYEVCVWKEQVVVNDNVLMITQAIDPHSVHIPEVIDAIRALTTGISKEKSRRLTDDGLNLLQGVV